MRNELIPFITENHNRYFYDPLLREIFLYREDLYRERELACHKNMKAPSRFKPLTGQDVEFRLANISQVTTELTERCGLNCLYCAYGSLYSQVNRVGLDIPFAFIRNILEYLNKKMNSSLNISRRNPFYISFYGGEPLLKFDLVKETVALVEKMNFTNNVVVFSMTTNGLLLDKTMDYLKEHGFRLLISLDGDRDGNRLRVDHKGVSQFDRIFANVKALQTKYPEYFKSHVNFNAVLNRHNSVESITGFMETQFGKLPTISAINPYGLNPAKIAEFYHIYHSPARSFDEAEQVTDMKEKFFIHHPEVKEAFMFLRSVCGNSFRDYNSFLVDDNTRRLPTGTCLPFSKRMFVSAKGALLPCETVSHGHAFGYVDETGVDLDPDNIAAIYNHAFTELAEQCGQCYGEDTCAQCLFQLQTKSECKKMVTKTDLEEKFSRAMTFVENNPGLYTRLMEDVCVE